MAGFDIEDVGGSVKKIFTGKTGKYVLIGGGVLLVGILFMRGRSGGGGGEVVLDGYPAAPTADESAGGNTADQLAALSDTFTESLTNMNTQFTDVLNAQQESFQTQIDGITAQMSNQAASFSQSLNLMNDNVSEQIAVVNKSVADVSSGLLDYASGSADKFESYQPDEAVSFGGANYATASTAVRQKMVSDMKLIKSGNQEFIESDLARTNKIIADRIKNKQDISAQLKHRDTLLKAAK